MKKAAIALGVSIIAVGGSVALFYSGARWLCSNAYYDLTYDCPRSVDAALRLVRERGAFAVVPPDVVRDLRRDRIVFFGEVRPEECTVYEQEGSYWWSLPGTRRVWRTRHARYRFRLVPWFYVGESTYRVTVKDAKVEVRAFTAEGTEYLWYTFARGAVSAKTKTAARPTR